MAQFEKGQTVRVQMDGHRFNGMVGEVERVLDDGEGGYIIAANTARYKFQAEQLVGNDVVMAEEEATREMTASAPARPSRNGNGSGSTEASPPNAMDPESAKPSQ